MLALKIMNYTENYFDSCVDLVATTWNLHSEFVELENPKVVYEHFFMTCLNWNEHLEIIVDRENEVKGILFGSVENESFMMAKKFRKEDKRLRKWTKKRIADGDFGQASVAKKVLDNMAALDKKGEVCADQFDSEINLFIVSPELRGRGLGRQLMDNYVEFCRRRKLKSIFLWTDLGCSYSFYEKYGFSLFKRFSKGNSKEAVMDGMIYTLYLK